MGTATGSPATVDSFVVPNPPPARATSVDVPPISNVMTFSNPESRAAYCAPITPPAGPERIVRTGSREAALAEMIPPFDCITRTRISVAVLPTKWGGDFFGPPLGFPRVRRAHRPELMVVTGVVGPSRGRGCGPNVQRDA